MAERIDKELEEFRRMMEVPSRFDEGFRWSSLFGALFIALLMVPGGIYMGLLAGGGLGPASQWVTVILFLEVARRAHRHLTQPEIFVLFFMSASAMALPFGGLLWSQFFVNSDAAAAAGIAEQIPRWFAPPPESQSYADRSFFHPDWFPAIGMVIFGTFFGELANMVLGYGLFRVTSDFEKLPFPMAPIGAQGIVAMAEDIKVKSDKDAEKSWRWQAFSIGGALGLVFNSVYLFLPTISGALTGSTVQILPLPFSDFTATTGRYLPAVATGLVWDLGGLIVGMVMPFFSMVGSLIALIMTMILNPILYHKGILHNWKFGDSTVETGYNNSIDFYFSFGIGVALAIAIVGFYQVFKSVRTARRKAREAGARKPTLLPSGRGDFRTWIVVVCYFLVTMTYIGVSIFLLCWYHGGWTSQITNVLWVLLLLGFVYTPVISYVTARLEGMVGQAVEIPMIREASLILSGYRGVAIWFLPIPLANYGGMTVFYRQCELTGTRFSGIWKTKLILFPIILVSSIFFMNFIWSLDTVPSSAYPMAQMTWELNARGQCITYSATTGQYSVFEEAWNWVYVAVGAVFCTSLFAGLGAVSAPVMLTYGVIRGLGSTMHGIIPQFIGALIGRYYFKKRFGSRWMQYIPIVTAGYFCGAGLIATVGVGITFLSKAVIRLPF